MPERRQLSIAFLARNGWENARREHLAGDASNRKYERLHHDTGETAVLMDAPPARGEDIGPFITITQHLQTLGLSAPQILARDEQNGFLLLEDFGDALFARLIRKNPQQEAMLYTAAVDLLIELHRHPPLNDLLDYTPSVMAQYAAPAFDWYQTAIIDTLNKKDAVLTELGSVLSKYCTQAPVMALRDFHAENLLWLPERQGVKRVGLLDYQDAVKAHPAYDLVSLLEDARRDVSYEIQTKMITHYIHETGVDDAAFRTAYAALGAQRNLRILGIFTRLCLKDGKPGYIDLIPRVWSHLKQDLSHPALGKLNSLIHAVFPEPTAGVLQRLQSKCANPRKP